MVHLKPFKNQFKIENVALRADVKYLMEQNSILADRLDKMQSQVDDLLETTAVTTALPAKATLVPYLDVNGPFKASRNNIIGKIISYDNNFEFSMDIKYTSYTSGFRQLLHVGPSSEYSSRDSLVYLFPRLNNGDMSVHFWVGGRKDYHYIKFPIEQPKYFQWHQELYETINSKISLAIFIFYFGTSSLLKLKSFK